MNDQEMSNTERGVQCFFCDNEYISSAIGEHLMQCGNKTDQCPKCEKYIRRAVFAYHYENNCANLDETEGHTTGATEKCDTSPAIISNNTSQSPTTFNTGKQNSIKVATNNFPTTSEPQSTNSSQWGSNLGMIVNCPFCNQQCEISERNIHQERCLRNPNSMIQNQLSRLGSVSNHYSNISKYSTQTNGFTNIPCEFCKELIDWKLYIEHVGACLKREKERIQNNLKEIDGASQITFIQCKYCDGERPVKFLTLHEAFCARNPHCVAIREKLKNLFCRQRPSSPPLFYYPRESEFMD